MPTARARGSAPVRGARPLFDAAAMRDADARAGDHHHIPSVLLMERAGLESARAIMDRYPAHRRAVVLVGRGNNGGDGMVVARHLADAGWTVDILSVDGAAPSTADARVMSAVAMSIGLDVRPFDAAATPPADAVVVDALLGTGTAGAPREPLAAMVRWCAAAAGPVVALDVPTGVSADTGHAPGDAVRADLTVTYHGDMVGLRVWPGRALAGEVRVVDIGIPAAVRSRESAWLLTPRCGAAIPPKEAGAEKYGAGAVLVVAGTPGMTGAARLATTAALRAGAGLVVAAVPAPAQPLVAAGAPEVMTAPLAHRDGHLAPESLTQVLAETRRASAVALGPGLGRADATTTAVLRLVCELERPMILDADGLWHLGADPAVLAGRGRPTVITPHAGEAARLLGMARQDVDADRLGAVRELARAGGAVTVLKGPGTLVADPDGRVLVLEGGGPALATAGSGDVLTGIIAAALSKGMAPLEAAGAAVALHAEAAVVAARGDGTVAGDLVEALPAAMRRLREAG